MSLEQAANASVRCAADTAQITQAPGASLGLILAQSIAFAHRGTLLIDSGPNGTSFVCRLPTTPR